MKKFVWLAALILTSLGSQAFADSVHSVVRGHGREPHIVKFTSGAVEFVEQGDERKLAAFEAQMRSPSEKNFENLLEEEDDYAPSVVPDAQIPVIWSKMNPFMKRRSECTDRAHVWSWDEFQRSGTKSEKAFLFLTDTYIKRHRYKWWFHVAPMFTTASGKKMVLDFQFVDHPVTFTEWKNNLVFTGRECVTEFRFLDYDAGADQTQDCYQKWEPMYYRLPGDIGARENGRPRTDWNLSEVNSSRARAFSNGRDL